MYTCHISEGIVEGEVRVRPLGGCRGGLRNIYEYIHMYLNVSVLIYIDICIYNHVYTRILI
jgi:hypothetical protein